jgi:hypothetical protein
VALNPLFDSNQSGTAAALPWDLAAGWSVYTESWKDVGFFTVQSNPILGILCQHRNYPTPKIKRLFVQFLIGCFMFYMVMLYMETPMTGAYGANGGQTISTAAFGYFLGLFYNYFANMPCMQKPGASAAEKQKADQCTKVFLGIMCLVSLSTLGKQAISLGKFANGGESYCDKCINSTSASALAFDAPKSAWNCTAQPGTHSNPIATEELYDRLCPWSNPFVPWLIAYIVQWGVAMLQAPAMFIKSKRDYGKVLVAQATEQGVSGAKSMVEPLNVALQANGLKPFDLASAQSKAVGLQFMAVARSGGNPYKLCGDYGKVVLTAAAVEFKKFLAAVGEPLEGEITMKHVCGWCGWQLDGGNKGMSGLAAPAIVHPPGAAAQAANPIQQVEMTTMQTPMQAMTVQVPEGAAPGAVMMVPTPAGEQLQVIVPNGATAGSTFQVQYPGAAAGEPPRFDPVTGAPLNQAAVKMRGGQYM